jgi:hypothetical protein
VAAKDGVMAPTKVIVTGTFGAYSDVGERLTVGDTPAVTIVAACIDAETGVGDFGRTLSSWDVSLRVSGGHRRFLAD